MIEAWSVAQVYAAEAALMAELAEGELMARAVEGLIEVASVRLEHQGGHTVVALVGPGNNGADALFATAGLAVTGFACAAVCRPGYVHAGARAAALDAGVVLIEDPDDALDAIGEADLVLDGILGIGGRAPLPGWARGWVAAISDDAYVIAVDTPSGHDPDGGAVDPDGVWADETVTFSLVKAGHVLPPTEAAAGLLTVVDIGLTDPETPVVRRLTRDDLPAIWPVPGARDDKYSRGVLGVVAGSERYPGAAVLTTTAAVEAGVGMVRYVGPATPRGLVLAAVPEVVLGEGRVQAWVVGPGLDAASDDPGDASQLAAARSVLAEPVPCVVDAGGLDLLDAEVLAARAASGTLLTPHAGECARLLGRLTGESVTRAEVEAAPVSYAARLAEVTGAVVLLKGSTTLVASPGGAEPLYSQQDAPAWLATAGAGDVLAGVLGALVAAGMPLARAGALGALVHGVAAERANPRGPVRALAVAQTLPGVIAEALRRGGD